MMIAAVALAAYSLINLATSLLVTLVWRTRAVAPTTLPPAVRARRLWLLRLTPTVVGLSITAIFVMPAFINYEPIQDGESSGPVFLVLGAFTLLQFGFAGYVGARSWWSTRRVKREYEAGAQVPPIVALVGIFDPVLIVSRHIVEACDEDEIARIVAHERGHLRSHDNIKRWVMHFLTGILRPTSIHAEIVDAWHQASEDAADDAATGDDVVARADLAALLLKVVRLAPQRTWSDAIISPFVENDRGLERRVRRLLRNDLEAPAPLAILPMIAIGLIFTAAIAVMASPAALESIFDLFEALVALGR
jgi:Zn-dependent protease with chaperone function